MVHLLFYWDPYQDQGFFLYHYRACSSYNCLCELHPCTHYMGNYTKRTSSICALDKICEITAVMLLPCTLLTSNNTISSAIWRNKHLEIFQRQQIAFAIALRACAFFLSLILVFIKCRSRLERSSPLPVGKKGFFYFSPMKKGLGHMFQKWFRCFWRRHKPKMIFG